LVTVEARSADAAVAPGGTAAYRFTVENGNPMAVRVTLAAVTDGGGWTATLRDPDGTGPLAGPILVARGASAEVVLRVTAPAAAGDGEQVTTEFVVTAVAVDLTSL